MIWPWSECRPWRWKPSCCCSWWDLQGMGWSKFELQHCHPGWRHPCRRSMCVERFDPWSTYLRGPSWNNICDRLTRETLRGSSDLAVSMQCGGWAHSPPMGPCCGTHTHTQDTWAFSLRERWATSRSSYPYQFPFYRSCAWVRCHWHVLDGLCQPSVHKGAARIRNNPGYWAPQDRKHFWLSGLQAHAQARQCARPLRTTTPSL